MTQRDPGRSLIRAGVFLLGLLLLLYTLVFFTHNMLTLGADLKQGQTLKDLGFIDLTWSEEGRGIRVVDLAEGSPAFLQGIREGDLIVSVNGVETLLDGYDPAALWGPPEAGRQLRLDCRRGDEIHRFELIREPARLEQRLVTLTLRITMPLFMAAYVLVGLWGLLRRSDVPVMVLIVLFCFSFGSLYGFVFLFGGGPTSVLSEILRVAHRIIGYVFGLAPGCWLLIFLTFPEEHPALRRSRWATSAAVFLLPLGLLVCAFQWDERQFPFIVAYTLVFSLYFFLGIRLLEKNMGRATAMFRKRQLRMIRYGLNFGSLSLLAGIVSLLGTLAMNEFGIEGWNPFVTLLMLCFIAGQAGGLLIPFTFLNSFFQSNMLESESALKKKLVYAGTSVGLLVCFLLGIFLAGKAVVELFGLDDPSLIILAALLLAIAFGPLRKKLMVRVEERVYPERTRHRQSLKDFASQIAGLHTLPDLVARTATWFEETLSVRPALLLPAAAADLPFRPDDPRSVLEKVRDRSNFFWDEVTGENPEVVSEERAWAEEKGVAITLPMVAGDEFVGTLNVGAKRSGEDFTGGDLEIFEEAAGHAAQAVRTLSLQAEYVEKKRMERDLDVAKGIQKNLMPRCIPEVKGLDLFGESRSCFEVAGDYFDLLPVDGDRLLLVIADVSGKGAGAALIMANLQASLRLAVKLEHPLPDIVHEINNLIVQNTAPNQFITFFLARWDSASRTLRYINAGHNPPALIRAGGDVERLSPTGMILGILPDNAYREEEAVLHPGDLIALFTDGYSEAMNAAGEEFGEDRLVAVVRDHREQKPADIARALLNAVESFTRGEAPDDDLTLILAKAR